MEFIRQHKVLSIITFVVLVGGGWYLLSNSSPSSTPDLIATGPSTSSSDNQQLVTTLNELRAVKLDNSIFSNPAFQSLQDFTTPITPEPVGRPNPFAPLSATAPVSANTTQNAAIFKPQK